MSILKLPIEVLQRIPTSYRQWKLLQLTSKEIEYRLGDYHKYHKLHCVYNGHKRRVRRYDKIVSGIIEMLHFVHRAKRRDPDYDVIYAICKPVNWKDNYRLAASYPIITASWDELIIYDSDYKPLHGLIRHCNCYECCRSDGAIIGEQRYNYHSNAQVPSSVLHERIYDELPALYSIMGKFTINRPYVDKKCDLGPWYKPPEPVLFLDRR